MFPIILVGHAHLCPRCGPATIISGIDAVLINNRPVACMGDRLSCGATITSGSPAMTVHGRAVARVGDSTDHGGILENGERIWSFA